MNIFGRELKISFEKRSQQSSDHTGWFTNAFGAQTRAGVTVNEQTALGLSAFWQGIRIISETMAILPIGLYEVADNGNTSRLRSHRSDVLISRRPSSLLNSYKFRETLTAQAVLRGNAYAHIVRDGSARPVELRILNPHYVTPFLSGGDLYYRVFDGQRPIHHLDMLHLRGVSILQTLYNDHETMGLLGENPLFRAKDSLSVGVAAQDHEGDTFGKGAHMEGYLSTPNRVEKGDREAVEDSFQRRYLGLGAKSRIPLFGGGMEFKRFALSPQESMLIESRKFSVEEVARILNIPQHKLGHLDKASFNNIEQLARDFYIQTVRPWAENWESELTMKLLSEREKESGRYEFRFDYNDLLRSDTKTMGELLRTLANYGFISIDDGRRMMGMNVLGTEWSQQHWVQLNLAPADHRPEPKLTNSAASGDKTE